MTKQTTLGLGTVTLGVIVALAGLLLFASSALAAGGVSADSQNIAPQGTATITVTGTYPATGGLGNWLVAATVNNSDLTVVGCTVLNTTCALTSSAVATFANACTNCNTGTTVIGTLDVTGTATFTSGCKPVTLTVTAFDDFNGDPLAPTVTNGQVCIEEVTNSPSPTAVTSSTASPTATATAKALPATGGPAGDSSSVSLSLLLGAAGLVVVAGGAWTVARARRNEN